ncbi:hypothetical protein [Streptomyces apocyni]|uniref:hypothetical protein n=1 Tax=Streptomyces apocyni TaxID=2654677 RepID=UPI0012EA2234|nr:hypothetical protein [Streptomyces apocyni]
MSAAAPSFPDPDSESFDRYRSRLLLWVWDRVMRDPDLPVPCAEFGIWQAIPQSTVWSLVDRLSEQLLISAQGSRQHAPVVTLLPAGVAEARLLQARRADPVRRGRHATSAVLRWIYASSDRQPLRIEAFFDSGEVFFLGEALSRSEVARALSYLADSRLITCTGPEFQGGVGSEVALTALGTDAVLSEGEVGGIGEFVARQRQRAQQTHIEAATVNYAQGDFHHTVSVQTALSPAELGSLIQQLAPVLALDDEARAALLASAAALARTGDPGGDPGGGAPDPDRQRGLMERVRSLLGGTPDTVGRQVALDAIGQALGRLLGG